MHSELPKTRLVLYSENGWFLRHLSTIGMETGKTIQFPDWKSNS
jgi:hypothetical protein